MIHPRSEMEEDEEVRFSVLFSSKTNLLRKENGKTIFVENPLPVVLKPKPPKCSLKQISQRRIQRKTVPPSTETKIFSKKSGIVFPIMNKQKQLHEIINSIIVGDTAKLQAAEEQKKTTDHLLQRYLKGGKRVIFIEDVLSEKKRLKEERQLVDNLSNIKKRRERIEAIGDKTFLDLIQTVPAVESDEEEDVDDDILRNQKTGIDYRSTAIFRSSQVGFPATSLSSAVQLPGDFPYFNILHSEMTTRKGNKSVRHSMSDTVCESIDLPPPSTHPLDLSCLPMWNTDNSGTMGVPYSVAATQRKRRKETAAKEFHNKIKRGTILRRRKIERARIKQEQVVQRKSLLKKKEEEEEEEEEGVANEEVIKASNQEELTPVPPQPVTYQILSHNGSPNKIKSETGISNQDTETDESTASSSSQEIQTYGTFPRGI